MYINAMVKQGPLPTNVNQFLHLINEVRDYPNTDSKMDEVMGEMIPTKDKE